MASTIEDFLELCKLREVPVQPTLNAFHYKIRVEGKVVDCWPTTNKFATPGEPPRLGLNSYILEKFPAVVGSYLNNYIIRDCDTGEFKYLLQDGTHSAGYKFREDALFEFGKYCYVYTLSNKWTPS